MVQVFIDESGNLGRNEGYFVISMLVLQKPKRIKNIIKNFCSYHQLVEVHAADLDFPKKNYLINKLIRQNDYEVHYIVVDKMMVQEKKLFESNNLLFNYLFSFLVKDIFQSNKDDVFLHLDNRTQKVSSLNSLKEYISIKAYTDWGFTKNLNLEYFDSKSCKAVQMADLVANAVYRKYHWGKSDFYNRLKIKKSINFPVNKFRKKLTF